MTVNQALEGYFWEKLNFYKRIFLVEPAEIFFQMAYRNQKCGLIEL